MSLYCPNKENRYKCIRLIYDNVTDIHDQASFTRVILDPVSPSSGLLVGIQSVQLCFHDKIHNFALRKPFKYIITLVGAFKAGKNLFGFLCCNRDGMLRACNICSHGCMTWFGFHIVISRELIYGVLKKSDTESCPTENSTCLEKQFSIQNYLYKPATPRKPIKYISTSRKQARLNGTLSKYKARDHLWNSTWYD